MGTSSWRCALACLAAFAMGCTDLGGLSNGSCDGVCPEAGADAAADSSIEGAPRDAAGGGDGTLDGAVPDVAVDDEAPEGHPPPDDAPMDHGGMTDVVVADVPTDSGDPGVACLDKVCAIGSYCCWSPDFTKTQCATGGCGGDISVECDDQAACVALHGAGSQCCALGFTNPDGGTSLTKNYCVDNGCMGAIVCDPNALPGDCMPAQMCVPFTWAPYAYYYCQ